nr:hypothetical protein [Propionibacteriales bacterium]
MSRRFQASGLVVSAAVAFTLAVSPPASADPDPVVPSRQSVDAAQDLVVDKLRSVASIRADLAAANQQLHDLGIVAEQESEAYNGAVFHWENAEQAVVRAERKASRASLRTDRARSSLVAYLVEQQISGAEMTSFSLALTADGPHSLITQMSASAASERILDARYQRWQAASQLSQVYEVSAEDALTESAGAKQAATDAKQTAVDAVEVQQDAVVTIAARRTGLMQELANAQNISVAVATQRQTGLEQRRQARIAEQRRLELLAEERQERREAAQQAAEVVEQRKQAHRTLLRQERQQRQANSAPTTTQPVPVPTSTEPVPVPTSTEPVPVPTTSSTEPVPVPTTSSTEPVPVPT